MVVIQFETCLICFELFCFRFYPRFFLFIETVPQGHSPRIKPVYVQLSAPFRPEPRRVLAVRFHGNGLFSP